MKIIECVPNFSEGQNELTFSEVGHAQITTAHGYDR